MNVNGEVQLTGSNAQKAGSTHDKFIIRNAPPSAPFPPRILDVEILAPAQHFWFLPKWMDKNGVLWGSHSGNGLFKSPEFGASWIKVMDPPHTDPPSALVMTDSGRAIWCTSTGKVYVSDVAKTVWALSFTFAAGFTESFYGHSKYKNIILLCSYGPKSASNPPRFVYASFDDGETFNKIYEGAIKDGYHVHHAVYDPWADRIIISEGDTNARQILYSDDRGATWTKVWPNTNGRIQPTTIIPTPYGIVFGSDHEPDGLSYWPRPAGIVKPAIKAEDIIIDYLTLDDVTSHIRHVFRRSWYNLEHPDNQFILMGAGCDTSVTTGYPRILASANGIDFYEIWKHAEAGHSGVQSIVGPHPQDPQRRFFATVSIGGVQHLLRGRLPVFTNTEPKRKEPMSTVKLLESFSIAASNSKSVAVNLSGVENCQVFIEIDRNFDFNFYPMYQESDATGLPAAAEALATNVTPPSAGRSLVYKPTRLPAPFGRFTIINKDAANPAIVNMWLVTTNKSF